MYTTNTDSAHHACCCLLQVTAEAAHLAAEAEDATWRGVYTLTRVYVHVCYITAHVWCACCCLLQVTAEAAHLAAVLLLWMLQQQRCSDRHACVPPLPTFS